MKRTMFVALGVAMLLATPAMAAKGHHGRYHPPVFSGPGESKGHKPIVRQPVEPCPRSGCPTISGPTIGTSRAK